MRINQGIFERSVFAISISETSEMLTLGLSEDHLRDAMAEIIRYMLKLGAKIVYGGDLRQYGFSELLFDIAARHNHENDDNQDKMRVTNYLAWPVHILKSFDELETTVAHLEGTAKLICLALDGTLISMQERKQLATQFPSEAEWSKGLTAMRQTMLAETHARIVLGGRIDQYKGTMPGIGEEALLSLQGSQPLFLIGGFGGCACDIAESMGLIDRRSDARPVWQGQAAFSAFSTTDLNNGLTLEENVTLARTPHIDQAIILILRGLFNVTSANRKL